jgi:hypothetical protein
MCTQKVWFVALAAMLLTLLTPVRAHAGSPGDAAQAEASKKKTSQKKGTNTASQGGSKVAADQAVKSPRDIATGQASGKRQHAPITGTKQNDKASPDLAVTKQADKASPILAKQGTAKALSAAPTPTPAIKKGTTSKR